jgi:hydroxylamine reductase (hybrid-cluster protein)
MRCYYFKIGCAIVISKCSPKLILIEMCKYHHKGSSCNLMQSIVIRPDTDNQTNYAVQNHSDKLTVSQLIKKLFHKTCQLHYARFVFILILS